jgi:hypothetical protein
MDPTARCRFFHVQRTDIRDFLEGLHAGNRKIVRRKLVDIGKQIESKQKFRAAYYMHLPLPREIVQLLDCFLFTQREFGVVLRKKLALFFYDDSANDLWGFAAVRWNPRGFFQQIADT